MFFPSFRRQARRRVQSRQQIEQLEPRELLVAQLTSAEVTKLLDRASMATSSNDAIIAVVDRGGHILGVRVEQAVLDGIDGDVANGGDNNNTINTAAEIDTLVYAIDGAVAKARTAAFFANGTLDSRIVPDTPDPTGRPTPTVGPLTSRTIRNISQSTILQREVQSNPSIPDPDSTLRGPGFVAPIGIGQHFPPGVANTPQVDLFAIEHTNRDSIVHPGLDSIRGTADDIALQQRFNIDPAFVPDGKTLDAPESYGFTSGLRPNAQARGIATLPGGLPIYRIFDPNTVDQNIVGLDVIGGIGVFFPGTVDLDGAGPGHIGDATFEQNYPNAKTELERTNAPKVLEAEYAALFAIGGGVFGGLTVANDRIFGGDFPIPFGRIDLVGITLQIIGPTVGLSGVRTIEAIANKPQSHVALTSRVNASVTTLTVNDARLLPADDDIAGTPDFTILIDQEVLTVTNVVGNTLTVIRGQNGTAARAHAKGSTVVDGTVQLRAAIDADDLSVTLTDASGLPATPFFARIDKEVLRVTGISGNTLTIERGQMGSIADKHSKGAQLATSSGVNQSVKVTSSVAVAPLTAAATTLNVPDTTIFPSAPFSITIDDEEILVNSINSATKTLMISRAQNGTVAASHEIGATIRTVADFTAVNGRVIGEGYLVTPHDSPLLTTASSTVGTTINAAATSLTVPDASVFPTVDSNPATIDFYIQIDDEVIAVTNISGNTLTILRAQRGTTAAAHTAGTTIFTTELTKAQVQTIIDQGIIVAGSTESALRSDNRRVRAAIRLQVKIVGDPFTLKGNSQQETNRVKTSPGTSAIMVLAVADADGNVLGLYRMHDSTIFSIDVAVAKARNTVYYAGPDLQSADQVDDNNDGIPDVPIGTAFTNRTFRFLAEPRFPQGVDGSRPGDFSFLNDTYTGLPISQIEFLRTRNPLTEVRAADNNPLLGAVPASAFQTVLGFDAFNPGRNFRDPNNIANQNGIVFFPGSTPVYAGVGTPNAGMLNGGFGISGDGVDQDDVVTFYGAAGFLPPDANVIADEVKVRNTRLPYQKFNRNPFG
jgi:uncharacterized protein GlcG (DUF336 family)